MKKETTEVFETKGLLERIDNAIAIAGGNPENPDLEQIGFVDEIHIRGSFITADLIPLLNISQGNHLLDIGSGIGGPARHIVAKTGAHITGVDMNAKACDIATTLTQRMGLSDNIDFIHSNIEELSDNHKDFDAALAIHVGMNIADKPKFYKDIYSRLRSGACLVIYDMLTSGNGKPVSYPAPWAENERNSFLTTSDELQDLLEGAGFIDMRYTDDTQNGIDYMREAMQRNSDGTPNPLTLGAVFGPIFKEMMQSMAANFKTNAISIGMFVGRKP